MQAAIPASQQLQMGEHGGQSAVEEAATMPEVEKDGGLIQAQTKLSQPVGNQGGTAPHPGVNLLALDSEKHQLLEIDRQKLQ